MAFNFVGTCVMQMPRKSISVATSLHVRGYLFLAEGCYSYNCAVVPKASLHDQHDASADVVEH